MQRFFFTLQAPKIVMQAIRLNTAASFIRVDLIIPKFIYCYKIKILFAHILVNFANMIITEYFYHIGRYYALLKRAFSKPERWSMFRKQLFVEIDSLALRSMGIISFLSVFIGGVITIQAAFGFESPWIPLYAVGISARDTIILELCPTVISLILAGMVGSKIASELGTMRVTEQLDAIEIMGVNSASYMVMPKIVALTLMSPILMSMSIFLAILGGWILGVLSGAVSSYEFIYGIQYDFRPYNVFYALMKSTVFAFIISSVSCYHGYNAHGGSVEVGRSSIKAIIYSAVLIIVFNYLLSQLFLV